MSIRDKKTFPVRMLVLPVLEVILLGGAAIMFHYNLAVSLLLLLTASMAMNLTLHIFLHECVHYKRQYSRFTNCLLSLLTGLPFSGYRLHHYNHHKYNNRLKDYSTTWIKKIALSEAGRLEPRGVLSYSIGWPRQIIWNISNERLFAISKASLLKIQALVKIERLFLALFYIGLVLAGLEIFSLYFITIYIGWSLVALHNYGQHPPVKGNPVTTYSGKWYNRLLFNNGLHWEHHNSPWLAAEQLIIDRNSTRSSKPHIFLHFKPKSKSTYE